MSLLLVNNLNQDTIHVFYVEKRDPLMAKLSGKCFEVNHSEGLGFLGELMKNIIMKLHRKVPYLLRFSRNNSELKLIYLLLEM